MQVQLLKDTKRQRKTKLEVTNETQPGLQDHCPSNLFYKVTNAVSERRKTRKKEVAISPVDFYKWQGATARIH